MMRGATSANRKTQGFSQMNDHYSTAELIDMGDEDFAPRRIKVTHRDINDLPAVREYHAYMNERKAKRKGKSKAHRLARVKAAA
jgi:hypothetical protein